MYKYLVPYNDFDIKAMFDSGLIITSETVFKDDIKYLKITTKQPVDHWFL